ncbi:MAG TPA: hypothetical protein VGE07_08170, partial [Herpetosiphonaceae bacterium]
MPVPADLGSLTLFQSFLAGQGFAPEDTAADGAFELPDQLRPQVAGSRLIAFAGGDASNNTLAVIWVPRAGLTKDVRRRIRRQLATRSRRDGLIVCTERWETARLYLLLADEDERGAGEGEAPGPDLLPEWRLNLRALRPADLQGLERFDLRGADRFELGDQLLRAFRRAARQTLFSNQGLFSNYYLLERLKLDHPAWEALAAAMPALRDQLAPLLEAQAVHPILEALGWRISPAAALDNLPAHAELLAGETPVALLHALPPDTSLDIGPGGAAAPDLELIGRLVNERNKLLWGVLTNGREWRLVFKQAASASGAYYQIDLKELLELGEPADLRWFAAFFGAAWLAPADGKVAPLNDVYQTGQLRAQQLGQDLKQAIFEQAFTYLAQALAEAQRRRGGDADSPEALRLLYRATLVLLYRLLFALYAESRELLPVRSNGYYPHSL